METIDLNEVENIFLPIGKKGNCHINDKLQPSPGGHPNSVKDYELKVTTKNTNSGTDSTIKDAYTLKSFLTYKEPNTDDSFF